MTPYERGEKVYEGMHGVWTLAQTIEWYATHGGFVFITPEIFLITRPVRKDADPDLIASPHAFYAPDCDCWAIHLEAGDMSKAWPLVPWDLPWVCFGRILDGKRKGLRFYRTETLRRLTSREQLIPT